MDMYAIDLLDHGEDFLLSPRKETETRQLFSIDESEFDTSTYQGRFRRNRLICNPFIAFYPNSRIVEM